MILTTWQLVLLEVLLAMPVHSLPLARLQQRDKSLANFGLITQINDGQIQAPTGAASATLAAHATTAAELPSSLAPLGPYSSDSDTSDNLAPTGEVPLPPADDDDSSSATDDVTMPTGSSQRFPSSTLAGYGSTAAPAAANNPGAKSTVSFDLVTQINDGQIQAPARTSATSAIPSATATPSPTFIPSKTAIPSITAAPVSSEAEDETSYSVAAVNTSVPKVSSLAAFSSVFSDSDDNDESYPPTFAPSYAPTHAPSSYAPIKSNVPVIPRPPINTYKPIISSPAPLKTLITSSPIDDDEYSSQPAIIPTTSAPFLPKKTLDATSSVAKSTVSFDLVTQINDGQIQAPATDVPTASAPLSPAPISSAPLSDDFIPVSTVKAQMSIMPTPAPVLGGSTDEPDITSEPVEPELTSSVRPVYSKTYAPSFVPTYKPNFKPTVQPTLEPTYESSYEPTEEPTDEPTFVPSYKPSSSLAPTYSKSFAPTPTFANEATYFSNIPYKPSFKSQQYYSSAPIIAPTPTAAPAPTPTKAPKSTVSFALVTQINDGQIQAPYDSKVDGTYASFRSEAQMYSLTQSTTLSIASVAATPTTSATLAAHDSTVFPSATDSPETDSPGTDSPGTDSPDLEPSETEPEPLAKPTPTPLKQSSLTPSATLDAAYSVSQHVPATTLAPSSAVGAKKTVSLDLVTQINDGQIQAPQ